MLANIANSTQNITQCLLYVTFVNMVHVMHAVCNVQVYLLYPDTIKRIMTNN